MQVQNHPLRNNSSKDLVPRIRNGDMSMELRIRNYQPLDRPHIVKCMEGLHDYIISVDQMKFYRRMPKWGGALYPEIA